MPLAPRHWKHLALVLLLLSSLAALSLLRACIFEEVSAAAAAAAAAHKGRPKQPPPARSPPPIDASLSLVHVGSSTTTNDTLPPPCPPPPPSSPTQGVLYFAYHLDVAARDKIIQNLLANVQSLRRHNPCIQAAVATNAPLTQEQLSKWHIDHLVPIDDADLLRDAEGKPVRQWWTRTLYLQRSPFDRTVQIDTDRTICGDISDVFQKLDVYDFLQVPVGYIPACDNGVMAWRKGLAFDRLIEAWRQELLRVGRVGDDQVPLARVIDTVPDLRVGMLNPIYQVKIVPALGESWSDLRAGRTLVLNGWAKIATGSDKTCERANQGAPQPRILVMDYARQWSTVFSQDACQAALNGSCAQAEIDWDLDYNVMSRSAYLKRYLAPRAADT